MQVGLNADGETFTIVHLEVERRLACAPDNPDMAALPTRGFPLQRSDDPRVTTCRLCKETPAWHNALAEVLEGIRLRKALV